MTVIEALKKLVKHLIAFTCKHISGNNKNESYELQ